MLRQTRTDSLFTPSETGAAGQLHAVNNFRRQDVLGNFYKKPNQLILSILKRRHPEKRSSDLLIANFMSCSIGQQISFMKNQL
jgi:hypothetical protein